MFYLVKEILSIDHLKDYSIRPHTRYHNVGNTEVPAAENINNLIP